MYVENIEYTKGLHDYFHLFLRRHKLFLIPAALIVFCSLTVAYVLPPVYESTAVILIEQPEVPPDLVRSTVTSYAAQRLQVIKQRVATTENLKKILERYNLYPEMRASQPLTKVAQRFRDDISMETINARIIDPRSGRPTSATIAFNLSYLSREPRLALQITNELVTFYLAENIRERQGQSAETTRFLARESERLAARIGDLEAKLADFKRQYAGRLPEQASVNLGILERTERGLVSLDSRIQSLEQQERFVRAELSTVRRYATVSIDGQPMGTIESQLQTLRSEFTRLRAIYGSGHPDLLRVQREIAAAENQAAGGTGISDLTPQLRDAREKLALALERYSSEHPEVRRLEALVDRLTEELKQARTPSIQTDAEQPAENPQYVLLQAQLAGLTDEQRSLQAERKVMEAKLAEYESRVLSLPEIERAYLALARDYENEQKRYRETKDKQLAAELSQSLETERKSERFTLLEPPQIPTEPIKPKRMIIAGIGLALAIGISAALVILSDLLDQRIYGRQQLAAMTGESPLVTVPKIMTHADKLWWAAKNLLWIFGFIAFFATASALVHMYLRPLDQLWFSLLRLLPL